MLFLLFVFYFSSNIERVMAEVVQNATAINDLITKFYYPAGIYIKLVTNFNAIDLILFIVVHIAILALSVTAFSKIYYKINSKVKAVKKVSNNNNYKITTKNPMKALIKKELNRFITTPVFVINAAFGLVLFVIGCILFSLKFDSLSIILLEQEVEITIEQLKTYIPVILFAFICFASLLSSITSSMISLEGKTFSIIKSLPIKPFTIIISKILTAVIIMLPFILIGDIIIFIKFSFNISEIIIILLTSIILPLVSETMGILINLKYPKMDAENDTEIVKHSISSMISVFTGIVLTGLTILGIIFGLIVGLNVILTMLIGCLIYALICAMLLIYLSKNGVKEFNMINI